jgi:two-component system chemotaxis sensor kinase CheA
MASMSPDRVRYIFAQEADIRLAELGRLLLQLEQDVDDETLVRSVFRELHTLKGSSAVAGLDEISQLSHRLEELVDGVRTTRRPITPELIDSLLRGVDELGTAIAGARVDAPDGEPASGSDGAREPHEAGPPRSGQVPQAAGVVMVPVERLEELTRLVGEAASAHLRVGRLLKDRFDVDPATVSEFNDVSRSINDLHDRAMRTQMVPVSRVTDQLHRAARDLARTQGKEIRWEVEGASTELDRAVLHRLSDSLVHLVRNAVDHGVETPEERERAGKERQATVRLQAMQLGSEVIIAVTDDGRGIDAERVKDHANRLGIQVEGTTDDELTSLIFQPGLSTTTFVTDVSGRGVGLDVVRTNVEAAHGRVEVRSEYEVGTEFRIIVPITVAVLRCLLVEVSGRKFALPFHRVLLTQARQADTVTHAEGRPAMLVDSLPVPVDGLDETLGLLGDSSGDGPFVVLADAARRHAFGVDRLIGQRDVVIKALSPLLPHLPAVAGASVEADGSILVVLDPPGLIQRARQLARRSTVTTSLPDRRVHRHSVLVVDDALIIRELQRGILERAGYDVRVASDGQQALARLAEERSDLVITDVEMPNMDGFALTEAIRAHPSLTNIPVLIVSSRTSDSDRQRGLDAGADGYITKSAFDEASLLGAVDRLLGAPR